MLNYKIIYQDNELIVIDKPAGINSNSFEKRVHRLDKDTSGILLIAKNDKSLEFFQKEFKERRVKKKYLALVIGKLKEDQGKIESLIGRAPSDRKKQKVYFDFEPGWQGKRKAVTKYQVLQKLKNYDLVEAEIETGRKHQIRVHLNHINHPIAGDKVYGFKNQPSPEGLKRQFLHAYYLKINLPNGREKEFNSELPEDLKKILETINNSS